MVSEEAIRFMKVPSGTLCYSTRLEMPSLHLRDPDLEYNTSDEIGILAQVCVTHKMLSICLHVLALSPSPSELTPRETVENALDSGFWGYLSKSFHQELQNLSSNPNTASIRV